MTRPTIIRFPKRPRSKIVVLAATALVFAVLGVVVLRLTHAATPYISMESDSGSLSGPAVKVADSSASGGAAVKFGTAITPP